MVLVALTMTAAFAILPLLVASLLNTSQHTARTIGLLTFGVGAAIALYGFAAAAVLGSGILSISGIVVALADRIAGGGA